MFSPRLVHLWTHALLPLRRKNSHLVSLSGVGDVALSWGPYEMLIRFYKKFFWVPPLEISPQFPSEIVSNIPKGMSSSGDSLKDSCCYVFRDFSRESSQYVYTEFFKHFSRDSFQNFLRGSSRIPYMISYQEFLMICSEISTFISPGFLRIVLENLLKFLQRFSYGDSGILQEITNSSTDPSEFHPGTTPRISLASIPWISAVQRFHQVSLELFPGLHSTCEELTFVKIHA